MLVLELLHCTNKDKCHKYKIYEEKCCLDERIFLCEFKLHTFLGCVGGKDMLRMVEWVVG